MKSLDLTNFTDGEIALIKKAESLSNSKKLENGFYTCGFCGEPTKKRFLPRDQNNVFCCSLHLKLMKKTNRYLSLKIARAKATKKERFGDENYFNLEKARKTSLERFGVEHYSKTKECQEKMKQTCIEKYGVENYAQTKECQEKMKQTCIEKYGVEHNWQSKKCREKMKQTCIEKYGVEHYSQTEEKKERTRKTCLEKYGVIHPLKSEQIKNKIKKTNLEKYGVDSPFKHEEIKQLIKTNNFKKYGCECLFSSDVIKEKIKQTNLEKYGVEYYNQTKECREKMKQTCIEKYGVEHNWQSKEIRNKIKETNLLKYGVEHALQNPEIRTKALETNLLHYLEIKIPDEFKNKVLDFIKIEYPEYLNFSVKQKHIKNYQNYNIDYVRNNFIKDGRFLVDEFMNYFGIKSRSTVGNLKNRFNILTPNKKDSQKTQYKIFDLINSNDKILNNRTILNGKELDIFIPSINLAIEYNGLMFHSQGISEHSMFNTPDFDKMYHLKKTLECKAKGITLFHIFEGEDLDLWLSMINNKLGLNERIFARKCEIREISNKECIEFLNSNHIQGYIPSKINIGLYYNFEYIDDFSKEKISKSTLVSLMTFSKPRFNNQYDYELIRFCSLKGFNVIGGASKLWKYFLKKYNPKTVISYANRRFSNGEVYQKLGFSLKGESGVNYFYFKDSLKLESRNKYQKHKLKNILEYYNPNESEHINMFKNGYRRIFDCGNLVFEYIK